MSETMERLKNTPSMIIGHLLAYVRITRAANKRNKAGDGMIVGVCEDAAELISAQAAQIEAITSILVSARGRLASRLGPLGRVETGWGAIWPFLFCHCNRLAGA